MNDWLTVESGNAPLIISIPHAGTLIPDEIAAGLPSPMLAREDADFHVDRLYAFASALGATIVKTAISRTVIDANRDPSGVSLYPGQPTTGLCPVTTFAGEPLYNEGDEPDDAEIARRRSLYFDPYHAALTGEIERLRALHPRIVLYEAHSIRSHVPRLFEGELPVFNIGTNSGKSCAPELTAAIEQVCDASGHNRISNGRFKGGWTTRHYGQPEKGVHAVQMELAMRAYLDEASGWPPLWNDARAAALQATLTPIMSACMAFSDEGQCPGS